MISFNIRTDVQTTEQLATILRHIADELPGDAIRGEGEVGDIPYEWDTERLEA